MHWKLQANKQQYLMEQISIEYIYIQCLILISLSVCERRRWRLCIVMIIQRKLLVNYIDDSIFHFMRVLPRHVLSLQGRYFCGRDENVLKYITRKHKRTNPLFALCEYLKALCVTCVYGQHKILLGWYFLHIFMVNFSSAQWYDLLFGFIFPLVVEYDLKIYVFHILLDIHA